MNMERNHKLKKKSLEEESSVVAAQTVLTGSVLIKVEIKNKWFSGMCPSNNKLG